MATFCRTVISGGLKPGRTITIEGTVQPNARRFQVDLTYGKIIALHYNPRFDENMVVLNNMEGDKWGSEERAGPVPFQRGQSFTITIRCENEFFIIMVDGTQTHKFIYRYRHLHQINSVEIGGDVMVKSVQC